MAGSMTNIDGMITARQADVPLAVEDDHDDQDSTYGASLVNTDTTSVTSSVYNHVYENGRRYQSYRQGEYILPNDENEQDRLDMMHHIYRLVLGGPLWRTPIKVEGCNGPARILDLGTGTGIWAMEVADELPESIVDGVDLSPIQPNYVPPNCSFVVDDFEAEWRFGEATKFDYIHGRGLAGCVANWPKLIRQSFDHLTPGGHLEFQEYHCRIYSDDGTESLTPNLMDWVQRMTGAADTFGRSLVIGDKLAPWMRDAGLTNVKEEIYKVPIGPWPKDSHLKELGHWYRLQFLEAVEPFTLALATNILGWSTTEAQVVIAGVKKDLKNPQAHLWAKFYFTYGMKPHGNAN